MKTYPYQTPDGIIELVEKRELDEMTFLAHDLASQVADFGVLVDKLERELQEARALVPIVMASDLPECECCEEPWCPTHDQHYADCDCVGPNNAEEQGLKLREIDVQVAVKRMEVVTQEELVSAYWGGNVATNSVVGASRIRDLLIKAAKGKA
jgi:hypothetical protein